MELYTVKTLIGYQGEDFMHDRGVTVKLVFEDGSGTSARVHYSKYYTCFLN